MTVFRYDKSWEGLLTAVFDAYARRQFPERLLADGEPLQLFCDETVTICTDPAKADRVWKGLQKRLSRTALSMLTVAWLSELPDIDGFEVCRRIRATNKQMGIIMLTARTQEMDKVTGLMTGADDYVTKPFSPAELTARIDALFRRIGGDNSGDDELLVQGPFVMNTRNHTLEKAGSRIRLTQVEYSILKLFMQNPGRALSREDILSGVWGREYEGELKIVDVNIRRLRIKIEDDTANPTYITTVWGFGYKWGI